MYYEATWQQVFAQGVAMLALATGSIGEFDPRLPLPSLYANGLAKLGGIDGLPGLRSRGGPLAIEEVVSLGNASAAGNGDPLAEDLGLFFPEVRSSWRIGVVARVANIFCNS